MLHFFRRIRQRLLTQNRFTKYLLYAVGEILLVVIGILIALQVNNWNEKRIAAENNIHLFREVSNELVNNIKDLDRVIRDHSSQDTLFFKVLNQQVDYEDYKTALQYYQLPFMLQTADLVDNDYKELLARKSELTPRQDSLLSDLKYLYDEPKSSIDFADQQTLQLSDDLERLLKEQPGYSAFFIKNVVTDEMIKYCLTDPSYRNELTNMHLVKSGHINFMLWFRLLALDLYERITEEVKTEKDTSFVSENPRFEQIKGVYKNGEFKWDIRGENELKMHVFKNDSLLLEFDISPYLDSHLIIHTQKEAVLGFGTIVSGEDNKVIGLTIFQNIVIGENGSRMMKKIE